MPRLKIIIKDKNTGEEGAVVYRPSSKSVIVSHPDKEVREAVKAFLTSSRPMIDSNNDMSNRHTVIAKATDSVFRMYSSLVEMTHELGVSPLWNNDENELPDTFKPSDTGEYWFDNNDEMHKGLYINLE